VILSRDFLGSREQLAYPDEELKRMIIPSKLEGRNFFFMTVDSNAPLTEEFDRVLDAVDCANEENFSRCHSLNDWWLNLSYKIDTVLKEVWFVMA
jgi:hypothetical protein